MAPLPESSVVIDPKLEDDDDVKKLANNSGAALLAFIAPHYPERLSPRYAAYATIGVEEEFGVESFIDECSNRGLTKLHCLVNSPGGSVTSSFKVARALCDYFNSIRMFVPHVAASGGTMIALAGSEIVMGRMSHLTPVDVQVPYNGTAVSTNSILRAFERFTGVYEETKMSEEEAPYTLRAMSDKLDPIVMEEMVGENSTCSSYIARILRESGVDPKQASKQARYLTTSFRSHATVLHRDALLTEGFRVVPDTRYPAEWRTMRSWLRKYIGESGLIHNIRYCLPSISAGKNRSLRTTKKTAGKQSVKKKASKTKGSKR